MNPMPFKRNDTDRYCCGSFWAYLMENKTILPQNLHFVGVADYPNEGMGENWKNYRKAYLDFEKRGCRFFPIWGFDRRYGSRLRKFITDDIRTPYVYVSLDLDVGSFNCVHAARYMDGIGISKKNLLDVAEIVSWNVEAGIYELIGMDIMEFNMHFLGIETPEGFKDQTLEVVKDFTETLIRE